VLRGYRILDCTTQIGWLTGRLLADLGADVVKVETAHAEIDSSRWRAFNVNKRLLRLDLMGQREDFDRLVAGVDVLIESSRPGSAEARHFDPDRLRQLNPQLVHVSITPFGRTGPRSAWRGDDLEIMAAGGAMSLAGEPDGRPVRVSVPQAHAWAGAQGAVGALTALVGRTATGLGQHVDVSAQASVILALSHAPAFWDMDQGEPTRAGAFVTGRSIHGGRFRAFWPCADGFLNFVLYGGVAGRRTNHQLVEWMRSKDADLGVLGTTDWDQFDPTKATQEDIDLLEEPIARFFLGVRKQEFLEEASQREMLGYPVSTVADIAQDPQLDARKFWEDVSSSGSLRERHCGSFVLVDGERAPIRYAAGAEITLRDYLGELENRSGAVSRNGSETAAVSARSQALAGVKVVEFGAYAAGPHVGKMLATFGATVLHVESRQRPDGFRLQYPPFYKGRAGINYSGCFAMFNDSKYGVTLDLKSPDGIKLARELVGWADVVVENMRPGVMQRLGLGPDDLRAINPEIVMLSSCNMGQTGPRANTPGFGSQLSALAGFCGLTGMSDGLPMLLYGPYIDYIASSLGAAAVLAAVDRQRRAGVGAYIDLAQYEAGLHFLADALFDYHQNGVVAARAGNEDVNAVPHNSYLCRNDQWIVISCSSDEEFGTLCDAMGQPDLVKDHRFDTAAQRRENIRKLDSFISNWAITRLADETVVMLQQKGVPAYTVNSMSGLFHDPQLRDKRVWRTRIHSEMGDIASFFSAFDLSLMPGDVRKAAPAIGADNEFVFRELLGVDAEAFRAYAENKAFD